jgi:hypothetical protein
MTRAAARIQKPRVMRFFHHRKMVHQGFPK